MPERILTSTSRKCPQPDCGSEGVREVGGVDASHVSHPKEDWPLERLWICNKCEKPFKFSVRSV